MKKGVAAAATVPYEAFLDSYAVASAWMSQYDIDKLVDDSGGLIRLYNFLPEHVAEGILNTLQRVSPEEWNETAASHDYQQNNISHSFLSTKQAKGVDAVCRLFSLLKEGSLNAFSAACYQRSHHIAPHDDRAYTPVQLGNGKVINTSRDLAVIYYLTKDWTDAMGGVLLDLEDGGKPYVPVWNSAVAFRVPRYHQVTAMRTNRPRYSIFGWFLLPGKRYKLYTGEGKDAEQRQAAERTSQAVQGARAAAGAERAVHAACQEQGGSVAAGKGQKLQDGSRGTKPPGQPPLDGRRKHAGGGDEQPSTSGPAGAGAGAGTGAGVLWAKRGRTGPDADDDALRQSKTAACESRHVHLRAPPNETSSGGGGGGAVGSPPVETSCTAARGALEAGASRRATGAAVASLPVALPTGMQGRRKHRWQVVSMRVHQRRDKPDK